VVVAVFAMGMMKMPLDQEVGVVAVRDRFVAAPCAVNVPLGVAAARMHRRARRRIRRRHTDCALVYMVPVRGVKVPVVRVVRVAIVHDLRVPAARSVHVMVVSLVNRMLAHGRTPGCA
jgi:hypothetical protein